MTRASKRYTVNSEEIAKSIKEDPIQVFNRMAKIAPEPIAIIACNRLFQMPRGVFTLLDSLTRYGLKVPASRLAEAVFGIKMAVSIGLIQALAKNEYRVVRVSGQSVK